MKPAQQFGRLNLLGLLILAVATTGAFVATHSDIEPSIVRSPIGARPRNPPSRSAFRALYHPDLRVASSLLIAAWALCMISVRQRESNLSTDLAVRERRLNLVDIMMFTAATAAGLALARYYLKTPYVYTPTLDKTGDVFMIPGFRSWTRADIAVTCSLMLTSWSIGLICVGLRGRSVHRGSWLLEPGTLAMWIATVLIFVMLGERLVEVARHGWPAVEIPAIGRGGFDRGARVDLFPSLVFPGLKNCVGLAVMIGWLCLALGRRWRNSKSWVDRGGRLFGAAWILLFVESLF